MNITFCCTHTQAEPWLQGLSAALPPRALVVRLEAAGMAVQMAEYVCLCVDPAFP